MASTWHATRSEWRERFAGWIEAPSPRALLEAATFFDFRSVAGTLGVEPLEEVLGLAAEKPLFLRFLARAALEFHPPSGLLLRLRGASASSLDLKLHGIAPVVFLARCYGLEAGSRARGTPARLDAAARRGLLDASTAAVAAEAHGFLVGLRLRKQLEAIGEGRAPASVVALEALTAVERTRLKDALRAVNGLRDAAVHHFRTQF
jgi:CBS domain-containing protein